MKKMLKRCMSLILVFMLFVAAVPVQQVSAASSYDATAALNYASAHWNDGVGLCAEFVSKCVRAGGLDIKVITTTGNLYRAVQSASGVSGTKLTLTSKGYATKSANQNILSPGDVVVQYCTSCKLYPHIVLCGGYDSSGHATFYSHNGALNNKKFALNASPLHTKSGCNVVAYSVHITSQTPVSVSFSDYVQKHSVGYTNAVLAKTIKVNGTSINNVSKVGIRLYTDDGVLLASKTEKPIPKDGVINAWYDVNNELGYTLQDNTIYRYVFTAEIDGKTYTSDPSRILTSGYPRNITVLTDGNGTASASATTSYRNNKVTLSATPNAGYHFLRWDVLSGGVTVTNNQFVVGGSDVTVKAIFEKDADPTAPKMTGVKIGGRASNALRLNWDKKENADGYIVEQYKGGKWTRIARIASNATNTYRVSGLSAGTTYKFRVKSFVFNSSNKAFYSAYTTISGKTNPSAVTGLVIGGTAKDALRLNWNKNSSASGYIIEKNVGGKWTRVTKITSNSTLTYRISGLSSKKTYSFRVRTYTMDGSTPLYGAYVYVNGTTK